jgi:hypothetical protein
MAAFIEPPTMKLNLSKDPFSSASSAVESMVR